MCEDEHCAVCQAVDVAEFYRTFTPRRSATPYVYDLLKSVPKRYLAGLDRIVLTDAEGEPRRERRKKTHSRKRKVSLNESLGYYQPAWHHSRAYIQLNIDRIFPSRDRKRSRLQRFVGYLIRPAWVRMKLARVLYHEIGHHIHAQRRPEYREKENVADMYMWRFTKRLLVRRCYLIIPAILGVLMIPRFWGMLVSYLIERRKRSERKDER